MAFRELRRRDLLDGNEALNSELPTDIEAYRCVYEKSTYQKVGMPSVYIKTPEDTETHEDKKTIFYIAKSGGMMRIDSGDEVEIYVNGNLVSIDLEDVCVSLDDAVRRFNGDAE